VRDIMSTDCTTVDADMRVQTLVDEHLLRTGQRCFVVGGPGRIVGLITSHEIKDVARDRWASTPLGSVMRPLDQLRTIQADVPAIDALTLMGREDVNQLPVMSGARFEGVVGRRHILQLLQTRAELNSPGTTKAAAPRVAPPETPASVA